MFNNLKSDGLEQSEDRLGGGFILDTDAYDTTIKLAYGIESTQGAKGVVLVTEVGGREYRETIYVTNRAGENFFLNKDDKTKKVPLPGFTVIDDICLCATGTSLSEQPVEEKTVKIYDYDEKKELPKSVPVLVELLGKPVTLGIFKNLENKSVKQGNDYVPTAETRLTNNIEKVFHTETKLTTAEARQGMSAGEFYDKWVERNKGVERDRRTLKEGEAGKSGRPGGPPQAGGAAAGAAPKKSLFGK
jgi:hypothetical protein